MPYVTGGVGGLTLFERRALVVDDAETFLTGNVGGGVNWYAGRWGLRGDYRFIAVQSKDDAPAFFGQETRYGHRVYGGVLVNVGQCKPFGDSCRCPTAVVRPRNGEHMAKRMIVMLTVTLVIRRGPRVREVPADPDRDGPGRGVSAAARSGDDDRGAAGGVAGDAERDRHDGRRAGRHRQRRSARHGRADPRSSRARRSARATCWPCSTRGRSGRSSRRSRRSASSRASTSTACRDCSTSA